MTPVCSGQNGDRDRDVQFVLDLLEQHGGQLPQEKIVDLSPWGKSKVSLVLSTMADEGLIVKLRIGRRNLVWLADDAPEFGIE